MTYTRLQLNDYYDDEIEFEDIEDIELINVKQDCLTMIEKIDERFKKIQQIINEMKEKQKLYFCEECIKKMERMMK